MPTGRSDRRRPGVARLAACGDDGSLACRSGHDFERRRQRLIALDKLLDRLFTDYLDIATTNSNIARVVEKLEEFINERILWLRSNRLLFTEFKIEFGRRYFVNVGSVGQPRDGDHRACYVTYDLETSVVELHRVDYDIETTMRKLKDLGFGGRSE